MKKVGALPPKDFKKWAVICEHIIRRYTQGWADGFDAGIEYWEIWNGEHNGELLSVTSELIFDLKPNSIMMIKGK